MNKELLLKVADAVEAGEVRGDPVELNMHSWHDYEWSCGTTACIGGYVDLLLDEEHKATDHVYWKCKKDIFANARAALDLNIHDGVRLMTDPDIWSFIHKNKKLVPDALRYMALTGKVDWVDAIHAARCVDIEKT